MSIHDLKILTVSANSTLNSLTLQALYSINEADLIVHDEVITDALYDFWSHTSRTLQVGAAQVKGSDAWESVIATISSTVKKGLRVTRIAADHPSHLNRLHEEVNELKKRGVKCRIIPHREAFEREAWQLKLPWLMDPESSRFRIIESTHLKGDATFWKELALASDTLAVDATQGALKNFVEQLLEAGADASRPVALVSYSPFQDPICWLTTLDEVDELLPQWKTKSATIFYVGAWPVATSRIQQPDFWGALAADAFHWLRTGTLTAMG